jgi:hypothetical protein
MTDCEASGRVSVEADGYIRAGGLLGRLINSNNNDNSIKKCAATGFVEAKGSNGDARVGGLVGSSENSFVSVVPLEDCEASGGVSIENSSSGRFSSDAGGLVGYLRGGTIQKKQVLKNCVASGSVSVTCNGSSSAGGLVGYSYSIYTAISDCSATGSVSLDSPSNRAGGLIGYIGYSQEAAGNSDRSVSNCTSSGAVSAKVRGEGDVGGLIGFSWFSKASDCVASGVVSVEYTGFDETENLSVGSLIGRAYGDGMFSGNTAIGTGQIWGIGKLGYARTPSNEI